MQFETKWTKFKEFTFQPCHIWNGRKHRFGRLLTALQLSSSWTFPPTVTIALMLQDTISGYVMTKDSHYWQMQNKRNGRWNKQWGTLEEISKDRNSCKLNESLPMRQSGDVKCLLFQSSPFLGLCQPCLLTFRLPMVISAANSTWNSTWTNRFGRG